MAEEELLKSSHKLVQQFEDIFNTVGRDKFIFYEDGDVNYKWGK